MDQGKNVIMSKFTRNIIVFMSSIMLFFAFFAFALHHHATSFQFATCSVCKTKSSISLSSHKIKIDPPHLMASNHPLLLEYVSGVSGMIPDDKSHPHVSSASFPYSNKAPPAAS
jgi:hypothetical protein